MPENSIPGGPIRTIVALLVIFGAGGALGMIYTIAKEKTVEQNTVPLVASIAVVIGVGITVLADRSIEPVLILLGIASLVVAIVGLGRPE